MEYPEHGVREHKEKSAARKVNKECGNPKPMHGRGLSCHDSTSLLNVIVKVAHRCE